MLVVFAAQHYASQLVLPASKRHGSVLPRSHNDIARKAFEKVTNKALPASHTALTRALQAEARAYQRRVDELAKLKPAKAATAAAASSDEQPPAAIGDDARHDELVDDDHDDDAGDDVAACDEDARELADENLHDQVDVGEAAGR